MQITRQLLLEAAIVGLTTMIVAMPLALTPQEERTFARELSYWLVFGALIHLAFEMVGLNKMYCQIGNACLPSSPQ
jgi:hypothetical protein